MSRPLTSMAMTMAALALGGCMLLAPAVPTAAEGAITVLPMTPSEPAGLAWLEDGTIITSLREELPPPGRAAVGHTMVGLEGDEWTPLEGLGISDDPACALVGYLAPASAADGRIILARHCVTPEATPPVEHIDLIAFDRATGAIESLVDVDDYDPRGWLAPVGATMSPDLSEAIVWVGGGGCATLLRWRDGALEPWDLEVGQGDRRGPVGRPAGGDQEACMDSVLASDPDWSPDGSSIAFAAAPAAIGFPELDRIEVPRDVYVVPAAGGEPRVLLEGVAVPRGVVWSPDGKQLLVAGEIDGIPQVVVVVDAETGARRPVATGVFDWIDWSPDGTSMAGIVYTRGQPSRIVTAQVPAA